MINHYYTASIMAYGYANNLENPLRNSDINIINIPNLIKAFENNQKIENNDSIFYTKKAHEIFTSINLDEKINNKKIQELEREILTLLQENNLNTDLKKDKQKWQIFHNYLILCLERSVLFTDNFKSTSNIDTEIQKLKVNLEYTIIESGTEDIGILSDLNQIMCLEIIEKNNFLNFSTDFIGKYIFIYPISSKKIVVFSDDFQIIDEFYSKTKNKDIKENFMYYLFSQALLFSLQYIIIKDNKFAKKYIIDTLSKKELRKSIINKRKNEFNLIKYYKELHNLK